MGNPADPALVRSYAPTGTLRIALNHGNRLLVSRDGDGRPRGVSLEIGRLLGAALGCEPQFVNFERAVDVSRSARGGRWDVCFLAVDPKRSESIRFTAPYLAIAGSYLVGRRALPGDGTDALQRGLRIGAVEGSAYTLFLARQPGAENLVIMPDMDAVLMAFDRGRIDGVAGIRQVMAHEAGLRPGCGVLDPPFMEIRQAMGTPLGRDAASMHLSGFLAGLARDGTLAAICERHGLPASAVIEEHA